jgi:outer membrane protein
MKTERRSAIKKLLASAAGVTGLGLAARAATEENKDFAAFQTGTLRIAHINSAELLQAMPDMKAADATLEGFQKGLTASLQSVSDERDKKVTAYQDKLKSRTDANKEAVDKDLQQMGAELGEIEKRINELSQKADQDYKNKSDELFGPILQKATNAVNAVAKEKGYAYVFDISQPSIIYFDGGVNILDLVKTKLGIPLTAPAAAAPARPGTTPAARP